MIYFKVIRASRFQSGAYLHKTTYKRDGNRTICNHNDKNIVFVWDEWCS